MGRVKVYWSWIEAAVGIFRNPLKPERQSESHTLEFAAVDGSVSKKASFTTWASHSTRQETLITLTYRPLNMNSYELQSIDITTNGEHQVGDKIEMQISGSSITFAVVATTLDENLSIICTLVPVSENSDGNTH